MSYMWLTKEQAEKVNKLIKSRDDEIRRLHHIIYEARERANKELKIAEENIKNSEQWLNVEEEQ